MAYIGEIKAFPKHIIPDGWIECKGQIVSIQQYAALFTLIGNQFGGNGYVTFGIPNLQGRCLIGTNYNDLLVGAMAGENKHRLTIDEIPSHNHEVVAEDMNGPTNRVRAPFNLRDVINRSYNTARTPAPYQVFNSSMGDVFMHESMIGNSPEFDVPHENMQPYLVMNYCIAFEGKWPIRAI